MSDELIAGTFTARRAGRADFAMPAPRSRALKQQMSEVAKVIIDRQIVASDAASLPQTSLAGGFDSLRRRIVAALDPAVTMVRMVNHRISALTDAQAERLDDIMAAPDLRSRRTRRWPRSLTTGCCRASTRCPPTRRRWSSRIARSSAGFSSA